MEIGRRAFGGGCVPVVPAAPRLGRYVMFGNLFASGGDAVYRIDRHPTMKHHPVTPMEEADLRLHLGMQTALRPALLDFVALRSADACTRFDAAVGPHTDAVLFDGLEPADMERTAKLIWRRRQIPQTFVIGSSGFTHGMADFWRATGMIPPADAPDGARRADRLLVMSGSCSPVTERQIRYALRQGFHGIALDPEHLANGASEEAARTLAAGRNVVMFSAMGPGDRREIGDRTALGAGMGRLLHQIVAESGVRRVVVAGGDTATHAVRELGITALTFGGSLVPGAPLCRAHSGEQAMQGLELVLKGGQVGPESFLENVWKGC